jgi:hypothetical protein
MISRWQENGFGVWNTSGPTVHTAVAIDLP